MTSTLILLFYDNYQPVGPGNEAYGSETYKFTGKPYSSSIGLYYHFHRLYDPSIGRFISPAQKHGRLSNPQSLNLYIYVLDRPTSRVDPTGLISEFHDRPCQASGCTSGPVPLFTAVSNWWNSLPPGEQQAIVFTAVVVIAAIVVVGTAGIASPLALAAVGAATSSTFYSHCRKPCHIGWRCGQRCSRSSYWLLWRCWRGSCRQVWSSCRTAHRRVGCCWR